MRELFCAIFMGGFGWLRAFRLCFRAVAARFQGVLSSGVNTGCALQGVPSSGVSGRPEAKRTQFWMS